jgi:UDP-2,3-diacylglucosamine pyrophosphatase LpxH
VHSLYIPDCHVGFDGDDPIHDEQAMGAVWNVARSYQPANIVILGDYLDLAGFGSYSTHSALRNKTNEALQEAYDWLVRLRSYCPASRIVYLEGNHEARINRYLSDKAPELEGIKQVGEETGALSLRHLLRLDELGIEYAGPYGTRLGLDGVQLIHGDLIGRTGGETAAKLLKAHSVPTVCGHVHRLELAYKTTHLAGGGPSLTWAMSCGTLARLDGTVPGSRYPDWQQGFGILWDNGQPSIHAIYAGSTGLLEHSFEHLPSES